MHIVSGRYGFYTEEFGYSGTGYDAAEGIGGCSKTHVAFIDSSRFSFLVVKAAISDTAKLIGVHACLLGEGVDLLHGFWL